MIPETGFFLDRSEARNAVSFQLTVRVIVIVDWQLHCSMASQGAVFPVLTESVLKAHYEGLRKKLDGFSTDPDAVSLSLDIDDCPVPIAHTVGMSDKASGTTNLPSEASLGKSALKRKRGLEMADFIDPDVPVEIELSVAPTPSLEYVLGSEECFAFSDASSNASIKSIMVESSDPEPAIIASDNDNDSEPAFPDNQALHNQLPQQDRALAISHLAN